MPLVKRQPAVPTQPATIEPEAAAIALGAGTNEARWAAARTLAAFADAAPILGQALERERDKHVRDAIFTGLVQINTAGSVEAVLPHLRSNDAHLRTGALDALKAMPGTAQPALTRLLRDQDADIRVLACDLAREIPSPEAVQLLADLLESDSAVNVCAAALDTLAEIGTSAILPSLVRCTERFADQPFVVFSAKIAAERIGARHE